MRYVMHIKSVEKQHDSVVSMATSTLSHEYSNFVIPMHVVVVILAVEGGATVLMFIFPSMIDTLANRTKHVVTFFY